MLVTMLVIMLLMMLIMMLIMMLDILFPHYVITYLVILIGVGLMRQGIVEAGDWHVCGVYVSVICWGWGRISVQVDAQLFFQWSCWFCR